ncbi:uncharacterized protein LOC130665611 [Microplitis mediator]|uniref:uncharacterized protein LOC130665611 n=1 Tax=Microplitis mediator TaxID=375433 RepID=UPI002556951E|nr:uncharacterized protein LOC130665611 [Microplitis mediator]XP_057322054.1 uncharacterized protein LOC130665611 [Microplitis mediator]
MSKITLILSIFVLVVIYSGAYAACPGGWCHPSQGYGCCEGHKCISYYPVINHRVYRRGTCITNEEHDKLLAVPAACPGDWCHPSQGNNCCEGHKCISYYTLKKLWDTQGICITNEEYDKLLPVTAGEKI